ncbi:MAG: rhodanese-like domain-containing protein [Bacteroidetes bacterium]|nr:rhodanese-like domain-containing protein [Bacteroidota bacterium]MBP7476892.1 rhodanese-like domain-containing protein [Chitinophagales bacterium]
MLSYIKQILGLGPNIDFAQIVREGAIIIDVRTKAEYQNGHIPGSQNIPLNNLSNHYSKFKKDDVIITCCASGVRSAQAKSILQANGFSNVYNGGGWTRLKNKIS